MMRAGKLDRLITIERLDETVAPSGAVTADWSRVAKVRAELVQQAADEFLAGPGEGEQRTLVFRIRWRTGLSTADRVIFEGKPFDLKQIVEIGRRRGLELRVVAA